MTDSMTDYAAIDAVNWSALKEIWQRSPLHYRHRLTAPRTDSPAMLLGRAAHCAILEPDEFAARYIERPDGVDGRTKDGKAIIAELSATGRDVLTAAQWAACEGMLGAVRAHHVASSLLSSGRAEVPVVWVDEATGIRCKGRADWVGERALVDLKTAADLDPRRWQAQAARFGHHAQLAYYVDGLRASGTRIDHVYIIAVESAAPHDVMAYHCIDDYLDEGRIVYREALEVLAQCRERDEWPGRSPEVIEAVLPRWAQAGYDDADGLGLDFGGE